VTKAIQAGLSSWSASAVRTAHDTILSVQITDFIPQAFSRNTHCRESSHGSRRSTNTNGRSMVRKSITPITVSASTRRK
jgi:hypothetical protein